MTPEEIEKEAVNHCNEVMCSICEKESCSPFKKCKEWRDRRAGYYCGIESREKRIEELEQQLAIQKEMLDAIDKAGEHVRQQINDAFRNKPSYADLEKENTELKEGYYITRCVHSGCPYLHLENRNCLKVGGFCTSVSNKDCPMMKNLEDNIKLTKAKELIRNLMYTPDECIPWYDLCNKAKQFLKEIENERYFRENCVSN